MKKDYQRGNSLEKSQDCADFFATHFDFVIGGFYSDQTI